MEGSIGLGVLGTDDIAVVIHLLCAVILRQDGAVARPEIAVGGVDDGTDVEQTAHYFGNSIVEVDEECPPLLEKRGDIIGIELKKR